MIESPNTANMNASPNSPVYEGHSSKRPSDDEPENNNVKRMKIEEALW